MKLYQRELPDMSNSNKALKGNFLNTLNLMGLLPVVTRLLVFTATMVIWLLVFKVTAELGDVDGNRAS